MFSPVDYAEKLKNYTYHDPHIADTQVVTFWLLLVLYILVASHIHILIYFLVLIAILWYSIV